MKIFYDCEFLEDGHTINLISIGMVREDGKEYYAINGNMPWTRIINHEWLSENVVPHLPTLQGIAFLDHNHADVKPQHIIKNEVAQFILEASFDSFSKLELWSWYAAYDHVALCQLWGRMIDLPEFVPMYTNDIKQEFARCGNPTAPSQEGNEHNALADAHYHKKLYEFIWNVQKAQYREDVIEAMHPEIGYWCPEGNLHRETPEQT